MKYRFFVCFIILCATFTSTFGIKNRHFDLEAQATECCKSISEEGEKEQIRSIVYGLKLSAIVLSVSIKSYKQNMSELKGKFIKVYDIVSENIIWFLVRALGMEKIILLVEDVKFSNNWNEKWALLDKKLQEEFKKKCSKMANKKKYLVHEEAVTQACNVFLPLLGW